MNRVTARERHGLVQQPVEKTGHVKDMTKPIKLNLFMYVTSVTQMNTPRVYKLVPPLNTRPLNKCWTQYEIQTALNQIKNKRTPEDIAKKLNRSVSDVRSRLKIIAADMYLNNKLPYHEIHEQTGVEKDTLILTSSSVKHHKINENIESDDHVIVNVSIYDFPEDTEDSLRTPDKIVNVDIKDNPDEMIITVSVESPFSAKSICDYISTPIFTTCSRFAKIIS